MASFGYFFSQKLTISYCDAKAHLQIAKQVTDGLTPGFAQLGGVWLPLLHLLMLPTVWIDAFYYSVLAGSIISMIAYVLASVLLFKTCRFIFQDKKAAFLAALVFMLNPKVSKKEMSSMYINKKHAVLIFMLISIAFWASLSFAEDAKNKIMESKEFSRDHTRATVLRESKQLNGLVSLANEIQTKWHKKNKQMYGALMAHTLRSWISACGTARKEAPMKLIRQYATRALSTYNSKNTDNISVESEFDLVSIVHEEYTYSKGKHSDKEWANARRKGTERWFHAWQRLESAIDKDWNPNNRPVMNVTPPKGIAISFSGIPPELIKDPALRAEYEDAIKKNREKAKIYNEQIKLRMIKKRYLRRIEKYIADTYSIPPSDNTELPNLLNTYVKDAKTRAQFLKVLEAKMPKK